MTIRKAIVILIIAASAICCKSTDTLPLQIRFNTPTSVAYGASWAGGEDPEWESRSLPIGNSSFGACVMGSISRERLTLNEKTLWTGGPGVSGDASYYWDCNKDGASVLPAIREAFARGDDALAAELTRKNFGAREQQGELDRFGYMTTLGEFLIGTGLDENAPVEDYQRTLSLDSALVRVQFRQEGISYKREYFVSYPDQALVMRFSSSGKASQNLQLSYLQNPLAEGSCVSEGADAIFYEGRLKSNSLPFALRVKAEAKGGRISSENGVLKVEGANSVIFTATATTGYKMNFDPDLSDPQAYYGNDPAALTAERLEAASRKGWKELFRRHYKDYSALPS